MGVSQYVCRRSSSTLLWLKLQVIPNVKPQEKLDAQAEENVTFDTVLAIGADNSFKAGKDCAKATVDAKVLKNGKGKKITVFTYKPKKDEKTQEGSSSAIHKG